MEITQLITWVIGTMIGIGGLSAGLGYGYGQFRKGAQTVDYETIASLKRQISAYCKEMEAVNKKLDLTEKDNKELIAINHNLQGQIKTYRELLTLQNPEFKEVITKLAEVVPKLVEAVTYCQLKQEKAEKSV